MEEKLNRNQILKIINLYKDNPILWNMSSKLYRRNDPRHEAYEDTAKKWKWR